MVALKNTIKQVKELVEEVKVLPWRRCLTRLKVAPCILFKWVWKPGDCMNR